MQDKSGDRHQAAGAERAGARRQEKSAAGTDRDHDEDDFQPLEQDRLEAREPGEPVEARAVLAQLSGAGGKRRRFVVQRDDSRRAQDRLAQPAHAEEQQKDADDQLQKMERNTVEQRPEDRHDQRK